MLLVCKPTKRVKLLRDVNFDKHYNKPYKPEGSIIMISDYDKVMDDFIVVLECGCHLKLRNNVDAVIYD
jgi:hypothetical protein